MARAHKKNIRGDETEKEANNPHPQSHSGHLWIIDVGNRCPDLWERTVIILITQCVKIEPHPAREGQSATETPAEAIFRRCKVAPGTPRD